MIRVDVQDLSLHKNVHEHQGNDFRRSPQINMAARRHRGTTRATIDLDESGQDDPQSKLTKPGMTRNRIRDISLTQSKIQN